jgi:hypothetical protein
MDPMLSEEVRNRWPEQPILLLQIAGRDGNKMTSSMIEARVALMIQQCVKNGRKGGKMVQDACRAFVMNEDMTETQIDIVVGVYAGGDMVKDAHRKSDAGESLDATETRIVLGCKAGGEKGGDMVKEAHRKSDAGESLDATETRIVFGCKAGGDMVKEANRKSDAGESLDATETRIVLGCKAGGEKGGDMVKEAHRKSDAGESLDATETRIVLGCKAGGEKGGDTVAQAFLRMQLQIPLRKEDREIIANYQQRRIELQEMAEARGDDAKVYKLKCIREDEDGETCGGLLSCLLTTRAKCPKCRKRACPYQDDFCDFWEMADQTEKPKPTEHLVCCSVNPANHIVGYHGSNQMCCGSTHRIGGGHFLPIDEQIQIYPSEKTWSGEVSFKCLIALVY